MRRLLCRLRAHRVDAITGRCLVCGAQVLDPIEKTR